VDVQEEAVIEASINNARFDLETVFRAHFRRIARVIAGIIRDPARAEELAVEVFLKLSRNTEAQGDRAQGWLYRTAVRSGLNELRRTARRNRYEGLFGLFAFEKVRNSQTPEDLRVAREEKDRVHAVLAAMKPRQAELLLLRNQGLSYEELASALDLNFSSIGTLLSRSEHSFRKEYINRYGDQ
jgi:RNA polymerase sigma-70 factor (ECF subfamily)